MSDALDAASDLLVGKHPLQRLSSPSRGVSAFLHVAGISSFVSSFKFLIDNPNLANESFGWHFQYLTIIGLFLALATFVAGLMADITLSRRLFLAKNVTSFCSTPLEVLISILYWGLRAIDKKLVKPEWMDDIGLWTDFGFHAMPAIMLAVDLLFFSPPWTLGTVPAVGISGCIAVVYWIWVELCYTHNGWYPYPLFEALSVPSRALLFGSCAVTMTASAMMLKVVYSRINLGNTNAKPGTVKKK